jgi:phage gpG-like protein
MAFLPIIPTAGPLSLEIDPVSISDVEKKLNGLADAIATGFPEARKGAARRMSRSVELNFRNWGRPQWEPLSPTTVELRRVFAKRKGKEPVAGYTTPLRVSDTMRLSMIALPGENVPHSLAADKKTRAGAHVVQIGTDVKYGPVQQEGYSKRRIPARPFAVITDDDQTEITRLFDAEMTRAAKKFNDGV